MAGGSLDCFVGGEERVENDQHGIVGGMEVDDAGDEGEGREIGRGRRAVEVERLIAAVTKHRFMVRRGGRLLGICECCCC